MLNKLKTFIYFIPFYLKKYAPNLLDFTVGILIAMTCASPNLLSILNAQVMLSLFYYSGLSYILRQPLTLPSIQSNHLLVRPFNKLAEVFNKYPSLFLLSTLVTGVNITLPTSLSLMIAYPTVLLLVALVGGLCGLVMGPALRKSVPAWRYLAEEYQHVYSNRNTYDNDRVIDDLEKGLPPPSVIINLEDKLLLAATLGSLKAMRALIEAGADVNYVKGERSILIATLITAFIRDGLPTFYDSLEMLAFLVKKGADINAIVGGQSLLHLAVELDNKKIAKKLLQLRINADLPNAAGEKALTPKLKDPAWRKMMVEHYTYLQEENKILSSYGQLMGMVHANPEEKIFPEGADQTTSLGSEPMQNHNNITSLFEAQRASAQRSIPTRNYYAQELNATSDELARWEFKIRNTFP